MTAITLHPVTWDNCPDIQRMIAGAERIRQSPLSALALAPHLLWSHQFTYRWAVVDGWLCLFADYGDGLYMPLPPLGPISRSPGSDSWKTYRDLLQRMFEVMDRRNQGTAVSRIENIPEELTDEFETAGLCLATKDPDYLYRLHALIELRGNRYKSQRAAYNRFVRGRVPVLTAYQERDRDDCVELWRRWRDQKEATLSGRHDADAVGRWMLDDAEGAHEIAFAHHDALGLIGRLVRVGDRLVGYTFGYERTPEVFCVLLEVADRTLPGAGAYVFREFCRELSRHDRYVWINAMDDSGLPALAGTKRAYRPCRMVPNYVATLSSKG